MARRQGGRWLEVSASSDGTYSILDSGCLRRLTEQMPDPSRQAPALWVFLGSNRKTTALRMIFGDNAIGRTSTDGELRLRSDMASFTSRNPILFVESDPYRNPPARRGKQPWQDFPIAWDACSVHEVKTSLFTRLLFPFATVVCIFVDDFPFGENVASFLATYRAATSCPSSARPCLIVIYEVEKADAKIPHNWRTTERLSGTFSDIIFVPLKGDRDPDSSTQYQDVQAIIAFHSQKVQDLRHETVARLSAIHMYKLFELATKHLAQTFEQPFDMVQASRRPGDIPQDLGLHWEYYCHLCLEAGLSVRDSAVSIASALIMDHYTPDMPLMNPRLVYQTLYRPNITPTPVNDSPLTVVLDLLEDGIANQFEYLKSGAVSAVQQRERLISRSRKYSNVKSNRLCLYCLIRPAQHATACDHPFCDLCAQLFGVPANAINYRFMVDQCLLCGAPISLVMDVLPPSMDPIVLAIDGGGVRGVIPLEFLQLVQDHLGKKCRLQDFVDLFVGPSAGGLIGIGLFDSQLPVADCARMYDRLARVVFRKKRRPALPWIPRWIFGQTREWVSWFMHDGCYDGTVFDTVLRDILGDHSFFHGNPQVPSAMARTKIAVIATDIADKTKTVVIGNFNAGHGATDETGYQLLRPTRIQDEPEAWEAGRATAAAPAFFPPVNLTLTLQDGGLTNNFAGGIARRISRTIWPQSREPARMLSLGTGKISPQGKEAAPHFHHVFRDGFLRRMFSAFMTSLDSDGRWEEMKSQLDRSIASNFRRFDVTLDDASMSLDDVGILDYCRNLVIRSPDSARQSKDAALEFVIAQFYFVLDMHPRNRRGPLRCQGTINCRRSIRPILSVLERLLGDQLEFLTDHERVGARVTERDICSLCDRFRRPISFVVHKLDQPINIYLRGTNRSLWRINGFPSSLANMISREQFDSVFGPNTHGKPGAQPCSVCDSGRMSSQGGRRKRTLSSVEPRKRRRICIVNESEGSE